MASDGDKLKNMAASHDCTHCCNNSHTGVVVGGDGEDKALLWADNNFDFGVCVTENVHPHNKMDDWWENDFSGVFSEDVAADDEFRKDLISQRSQVGDSTRDDIEDIHSYNNRNYLSLLRYSPLTNISLDFSPQNC